MVVARKRGATRESVFLLLSKGNLEIFCPNEQYFHLIITNLMTRVVMGSRSLGLKGRVPLLL